MRRLLALTLLTVVTSTAATAQQKIETPPKPQSIVWEPNHPAWDQVLIDGVWFRTACDADGIGVEAAFQRCAQDALAAEATHQEALEENKGWLSKTALGDHLPETYAKAITQLQIAVKEDGVKFAKENPQFFRGHMLNQGTKQTTKWFAINLRLGVWELTVEKPLFGETDFPSKVTISKVGIVARYDTPATSETTQ